MLKRVLAVLGVAFGSLAMFYLVFASSLTLKDLGLSVEDQLIAQRNLTPLLFVALPVAIFLIKPVFLRLDLSSFAKMAVNSTTCAKCAKSLGRVATFAKASASAKAAADEEHVEREDL